MNFDFQRIENIESGKMAGVGESGRIRQSSWSVNNRSQHWLQEMASGGMRVLKCRATGQVIDAIGGTLAHHVSLQHYPFHGNANQRWRMETVAHRRIHIFAASTNLAWEVPAGNSADGTVVRLANLHGMPNQVWRIDAAQSLTDCVMLRSVRSGHVIDVPGFSQAEGQTIQQSQINRGFNQFWQRVPLGNDQFKLRSVCSGLFLTYPMPAAAQNAPATLVQSSEHPGLHQRWRLVPAQAGTVKIVSVMNNFCVDVPNGAMHSGQMLQAYEDNTGGPNQRWTVLTE
jgi:hypothetical protein